MINFLNPDQEMSEDQILKASDKDLEKYLLNVDRLIKTEIETPQAKTRSQVIVQMCRRYRGTTPSDLFGFWSNGTWADSPKFASLQGTNVFQALVHGAESGYMQASILLDISAKANNFQNRSVEKIARSVYEVLDREQWDDNNGEQAVFYSAMLKLNAFVISRFNKNGGPQLASPQFSPMAYQQSGLGVCPQCYEAGDITPDNMACPQCGTEMASLQDPTQTQDYGVSGFGSVDAGKAEMIITDALDVTVDDRLGHAACIDECSWVQWRYFAQKGELQKLYPQMKVPGKPEWSYPTRLKVALKRYESGEAMPKTEFEKTQYEVKQTWLDRAQYEDYVAPASYTCGSFSIEAGQKLTDKCPEGMVFGIVNNEIAFIDNEDKNRRIKSCVWLGDPTSFYGLGAKAGLAIQKKINQLDNMAMEGEARSMKGSLVYLPEAIDGANLEGANTNIPLKPDFATGGQPMKNFVMPLDVSGLSSASLTFLATQVETMQRVMGIPNVTLGEGDPSAQTATGQTLIAQRASGLLVPAKKSEGTMRVGWLKDQLDIIQKFYSPEALEKFGARYGETWLSDEIQAFFQCNLDDAISVAMVEGSEIPETRTEKQTKLRNDIMAGFVPLTPEVRSKLAQQSGLDGIDVGNYESNNKLAQKRYDFVNETLASNPKLEQAYQETELMLIDKKTGQRALDPAGNEVPNPVVAQILQAPQLKIIAQAEDNQLMADFWSEKVRQLSGSSSQVPQVQVAISNGMITMHKLAAFSEAVRAQTMMGLTQAPAMAGSTMMGNALAPPEPAPAGGSTQK